MTGSQTRALAIVAAGLLILAACGGGGTSKTKSTSPTRAATPTTLPAPAGDAFYTPPSPLPKGAPGDLIWAQSIDAPPLAKAWRVLYHSRGVDGSDVGVSGVVVAPAAAAATPDRPVLSYAHETTGIADACAPSKPANAATELPDVKKMIAAGYVEAATDYQGLGTPGVHPYLVGVSEGRSVLDIARAARQVRDTGAGKKVAVYGYSQGGHAALFAGQIAPSYAPDLDIVSVNATAPVTDLALLARGLPNAPQGLGFGVLATYGFAAAYPQLKPADILTPAVLADRSIVETACNERVLVPLATQGYAAVFTKSPDDVPAWHSRLVENSPGATKPAASVYIYRGGQDQLATAPAIDSYVKAVCKLGAKVEVVTVPERTHSSIFDDDGQYQLAFIADRLAGKPLTTSSCPS
jgi:dienelactone hydrolase